MISKLIRINLFSLLFMLGTTAHFVKADLVRNKQIKIITFTNTTGYAIRVLISPVEQVFESSGSSETYSENYVFNLQETNDSQSITLTRYELSFTHPGQQKTVFSQIANMFTVTECIVQLFNNAHEVVAETTIDITNISDGSTYQVDYTNDNLTVTPIS